MTQPCRPLPIPQQLIPAWMVAVFLLFLGLQTTASAQDSIPREASPPLLQGDVRIDGVLDEPQWKNALRIQDYYPYDPVETGALPGQTDARIFYDNEMLYLGFHCQADKPELVRAHIAPREDINQDDQIGIYLDTFNNDREAFVFYINALGIQQDARFIDGQSWNQSWDTVLYSKGTLVEDGFVVEVGIPFRSLRFPDLSEQTWGLILTRKFAAQGLKAIHPRVTHNRTSMLIQAADLPGLKGIQQSKNLELLPSIVASWGDAATASEQQLKAPFHWDVNDQLTVSPGASLKYGVTSTLTLDATLNPDFSQVEGDPYRLDFNQRFALYNEERRPFFLEGSELYNSPYLGFYSRSVVSPLYGLKLTGRANNHSIAILTAYDTQPQASSVYSLVPGTPGFDEEDLINEDGSRRNAVVSVARVTHDLGSGSVMGATVVDREIVDPATGTAWGSHQFGVVDSTLRLGKTNQVILGLAGSRTGMRGGDTIQGGGAYGSWNHNTRVFSLGLGAGYESPYLRSETSFIPLVGVFYGFGDVVGLIEPKVKGVENIRPELFFNTHYNPIVGAISDVEIFPTVLTRFKGQNYATIGYSSHFEAYQTEDGFYGDRQQQLVAIWQSLTYDWINWKLTWQEGTALFYPALGSSPEEALGYVIKPAASVTFRPTPRLTATGSYYKFYFLEEPQRRAGALLSQDSSLRFNDDIVRGQLAYNLNAIWSLQGVAQFKTHETPSDDQTLLNWKLLLTWLPHPGTAAYLGISHGADETILADGSPSEQSETWQLFFKFSYLWRT